MASSGKTLRPRRKSKTRDTFLKAPSASLFPSKSDLLRLVPVIAIAASVAVACHFAVGFLSPKNPNPFCDSDLGSSHDLLYDFCEPCPDNARCYEGKFECVNGYQKHGRICIEDGVINRKAKELSELLEKHTCDSHARVLCGEAGNIWFQEADLAKILDEQIAEKFDDLKGESIQFAKHKALESVENLLEKNENLNRLKEFKCPDAVAELHKPIKCVINQWIIRNIKFLVLTTCSIVASLCFLWRFYRRRVLLHRAEQLYQQICEILEDNAINNNSEPWIVSSWLRDHLMLPKERKNTLLWKKVEELIQEDSRIDRYPKKIKGESKIVLEWQVDVTLSSKIRKLQSGDKSKQGSVIISSSSIHEEKNERKPILGVKLFS
ncbi:hypothetical protein LUZ60_014328 [Juncus effusus]|nr:hypothetical protein LUZ60_014328 [Juncus effusus]